MRETKLISKKVTRSVKKRVPESVPKKAPTRRVLVEEPKKATTKKVIAKKVAEKRSRTKTIETVTIPTKKKPVTTDEVVLIPGTVSQRLAEKVKLYNVWCRDYAPRYAEPLSTFGGYTFIVIGLLTAYFSWVSMDATRLPLWATLPCIGTVCPTTLLGVNGVGQNLAAVTKSLDASASLVRFSEEVKIVPKEAAEVTVTVTDLENYVVLLVSYENGISQRLETVVSTAGNSTTYAIPASDLPSGQYQLQVHALTTSGGTKLKFDGPQFTIPRAEPIEETSTTTTPNTPLSETQSLTEESIISARVENFDLSQVYIADNQNSTTSLSGGAAALVPLSLRIDSSLATDTYRVTLSTDYDYGEIQLYARPSQSNTFIYLGKAAKSYGEWVYWLYSAALPRNVYTLQARGIDEGIVKAVSEMSFVNQIPSTIFTPEEGVSVAGTPVQDNEIATTTDKAIIEEEEVVIAITDNGPDTPRPSQTAVLAEEPGRHNINSKSIFYPDRTVLDPLVQRYASAVLVGEQSIVRLAEAQLDKKTTEVVTLVSTSTSEVSIIDTRVNSELVALKNAVRTATQELISFSDIDVVLDTDKDGIADFEEISLYGTNPYQSDSDQDGFHDGVEIALGYDPGSTIIDTDFILQSPKMTSYVSETLLSVRSITPIIQYKSIEPSPVVTSEINGYGIPNSFVTLFIYSEPTVVQVKTAEDGSFSYVLDKELSDGVHEVFAAIVDNTGSIVASSNPFRFAKTAEGYTRVGDSEVLSMASENASTQQLFKAYNLIGAIGIVSFGLILLLLRTTVRSRRATNELISV